MNVSKTLRATIQDRIDAILDQINDRNGYVYDPHQLERALGHMIIGEFGLAKFASLQFFQYIMGDDADNWEITIDGEPNRDLDVRNLLFRQCMTLSELAKHRWFGPTVAGDEMRRRAVEKNGNLSLSDAPRLLAQQHDIPERMRSYIIMLPATVVRHRIEQDEYVYFLRWNGHWWVLDKDLLKSKWGKRTHFGCIENMY